MGSARLLLGAFVSEAPITALGTSVQALRDWTGTSSAPPIRLLLQHRIGRSQPLPILLHHQIGLHGHLHIIASWPAPPPPPCHGSAPPKPASPTPALIVAFTPTCHPPPRPPPPQYLSSSTFTATIPAPRSYHTTRAGAKSPRVKASLSSGQWVPRIWPVRATMCHRGMPAAAAAPHDPPTLTTSASCEVQ